MHSYLVDMRHHLPEHSGPEVTQDGRVLRTQEGDGRHTQLLYHSLKEPQLACHGLAVLKHRIPHLDEPKGRKGIERLIKSVMTTVLT